MAELVSNSYEIITLLLCHMDKMLSPSCEIATDLCHTDEFLSPTYEIGVLLLCHMDEMLSPTYAVTKDLMSYGRDNNSY